MRPWRSVGAALVSFLVFTSIVVLATQAEGREATLAESNDGGAWLVDRGSGGLAHIEYTTAQPTTSLQLATPGSSISAHQASGVIAVHDSTASTVQAVIGANAQALDAISVPDGAVVRAVPRGVAIFDPQNSVLWSTTVAGMSGMTTVDDLVPVFQGFGEGELVVGRDGRLVVLSGEQAIWVEPVASAAGATLEQALISRVDLPDGFDVDHSTLAGEQLVLVDGERWLVGTSDGVRDLELTTDVDVASIQQEAATWPLVAAIDTGGLTVRVDLTDGFVFEREDTGFGQRTSTRPILHDRCVHSLRGVDGDMSFAAQCSDGPSSVRRELTIPADAQLRLVNGNVWIDVLDGSGWLVTPENELEPVADFSEIFDDDEGEESADGDRVREEVNQGAEDAALTDADSLDDDDQNEQPIAEDDQSATRLGRPVVVDVLANDTDPDGDVILVTEARVVSGDAEVQVPTSANAVQVSPLITATEPIVVTYTISDAGGLEDSATVTVDVLPETETDNRPPMANLDRATGTASATISLNLLDNDSDPDGDSLALVSVEAASGVTLLSQHPDGEIFLSLPPNAAEGQISLVYTVRDEYNAMDEGEIRIEMRIDDTNTPPDARNDAGVTQVGRKITLDVLANDVDPDGDVLSIGSAARPVGDDFGDFVNTTDDGEFSFEPSRQGTFVFEYAATDGVASDIARIRIEVLAEDEQTAPVAVRDDVTLALGETQLVRAFDNDGDRDGDLFDLFERTANDDLAIVPVPGVGFRITLRPTAGPIERFEYRLTDGDELSNFTSVVVARSSESFVDAAPIARDDNSRVRPGRTSIVPVTRNDFDPEGGPVTVITATTDELVVRPSGDGQSIEVEVPAGRELGETVSYVIADDQGNTASADLALTMVREGEENAPPIARNDVFFTTEEQPVLLPVLLNDSDPENDPISIGSTPEQPTGGVIEASEDGRGFVYEPIEGFVGTDTFSYILLDSEGGASTATVRIGVMPVPEINRPPVAVDDSFVLAAGSGSSPLDVLANDFDPDEDDLSIIDLTGTEALSVDSSGLGVSVAAPASLSEDQTISFDYEISDGRGGTARAVGTVTFTANEVPNLPPVANGDSFGPFRAGETVLLPVVGNDTDPDGEQTDLRIVEAGAGTVTGQQIELVVSEADAEFTYTIADADDATDSTVVRVTVTENLPPEVTSPVSLGEIAHDAGNIEINLADYVTDPDGDELTFSGVSAIAGGNTRLDVNTRDARNVTFIPSAGYVGEAVVVYSVDDGNGHVVSGRVTLTILPPENLPPEAVDGSATIEAGVPQSFDLSSLFSDPDPDDVLIYEIVSQPNAGVSLSGSGAVVELSADITADAGTTSFVAQATDSSGEVVQATVTITLTESTVGPPGPASLSITVNQGESETIDVVGPAVNPLGDELTVSNVFASAGGSVSVSGRSITFDASGGFSGPATITYDLSDGRSEGGTATGSIDVTVLGRPEAPVGLTGQAVGPNSITLSWTAPAGNGASVTGYEIDINGERRTIGATPSYRFDDRTPGTDYFIVVRAINDVGEGDFSSQIGPITPDEIPGAPGTPSAVFGDGSIDVSWAAAPNAGSAISTYHLEIAGCSSSVLQPGTGTTFTWTGLTNGVECTFRAAAENAAGQGPWSSWLSPGVCPVGVPDAPGQPSAERGDKEATITWAQPTNPDCEPILGYELRRSPDSAVTSVAAGTVTWTSSGLTNGDTYSFEVRAENRAGFGLWSPLSPGIVPCGVPLAPTAPTAAEGDTLAVVTRTGDAPANGCDVTQYQVSVNGGAAQALAASGDVTGLTNGDSYAFRVRGINEIGEGEWSPASNSVIPFGPPFAVGSIAAVNSNGFTNWQWNAPDDNGDAISSWNVSGGATQVAGAGGSQITVECRTTGGQHCRNVQGATQPAGTACLQTAQAVSITVAAVNDAGAGPSTSQSINISGCPSAPTVSISNITTSGYTVNWSRPGGTQNIHVERDGVYGASRAGTSTTISFTGSSDTIRVWACNQFGCSSSGTQTVNQPQPQVSVSWGGVSGDQDGCNLSTCYTINYSWSNFAPNINLSIECVNSSGRWGAVRQVSSGGSGSGSGNTVGWCWIDDDYLRTQHIRINGTLSPALPNLD